jgi:hypothetical protein
MWIMFTKKPEYEDIFVKISKRDILDHLHFREDVIIEFLFNPPRKDITLRIYWRNRNE